MRHFELLAIGAGNRVRRVQTDVGATTARLGMGSFVFWIGHDSSSLRFVEFCLQVQQGLPARIHAFLTAAAIPLVFILTADWTQAAAILPTERLDGVGREDVLPQNLAQVDYVVL